MNIGRFCWQIKPNFEIECGKCYEINYINNMLKNYKKKSGQSFDYYIEYVEEINNPTIEQLKEVEKNMNNISNI